MVILVILGVSSLKYLIIALCHFFPPTPLRRSEGGGGVGLSALMAVKPPNESEAAEHLITVETRGKHILQRGTVTESTN